MPNKSRRKPTQSFRIIPERASTGDLVALRFAEPLDAAKPPKVRVGGKALAAWCMRDARTLVGVVPDYKAGVKAVDVQGAGGAARKISTTLRHDGRRAEADPADPVHGVFHFAHHAGSRLLSAATLPAGPGNSTWYMLGANQLHDANGRVPLTATLATLWQRRSRTPYTFWYAEPVLCDDVPAPGDTTIFLAPSTSSGQGETLAAVDAASGSTRWIWTVASGRSRIDSAPVCVDGRLFVARLFANTLGVGPVMLVCADAATGAVLWNYQLQANKYFAYVRLVAAFGSIFVLLDDGTVAAFDQRTGALRWQHIAAIPQPANIGRDESIAAGWRSVFVGGTNGLRALDPRTGAQRWISSVAFDCSYSQILVTNGNPPLAIAVDFAGTVYAFNALTGAYAWEYHGTTNWWPRMTCDFEQLHLQQTDTLVVLLLRTGAVRQVSPALGNDTSGGPTQGKNAVFQAIAPNPARPGGRSTLLVFNRATVATTIQTFVVNPTYISRPVIEGPRLFLNVSPAAATNFADYSVVQAIKIA